MPKLTIDGRTLQVPQGCTVLEAAREAGIVIPTLCYHPDLSVDGSCRLCVVEVDSQPGQFAACTLPAADDMVVRTETPALTESRRFVLEMLLRRYSHAGYAAGDTGETEFLHWVRHYGCHAFAAGAMSAPSPQPAFGRESMPLPIRPVAVSQTGTRFPIDSDPNPFVWVDLNKCILCTRCVRACGEVQGRFVWNVGYRGDQAKITAGLDTTMLDARCESCGACVAYCPTGALDDKMAIGLGRPDRVVTTTCAYCGVGCNFDLHVKDDRIIRVASQPEAPVNGMELCVKGRYGYDFVHHPDQFTRPRVRRYLLDGGAKSSASPLGREWVETDWDTALGVVAARLALIKRESNSDAVGFIASALCTNEENYLVQKLARQVIGTHNVENCARLGARPAGRPTCQDAFSRSVRQAGPDLDRDGRRLRGRHPPGTVRDGREPGVNEPGPEPHPPLPGVG